MPYLLRVGAAFSALASGMICLRLYGRLSVGEFGVVVAALQILNYLPLLDGGFRLTVNRLILAGSDASERKTLLQFYLKLHLYITALGFLVSVLLMAGYWASPAARETGQPLVFFLVLGVVGALTVGSGLEAGLLIGLRAQEQTYLLTAANAWLNAGVLWLALRAGLKVWAFPVAMLATLLVTYILATWLILRREPGLKLFAWRLDDRFGELFNRLRGSAWACFRSQVVTVLLYTVDVVFVFFLCGAASAGVYGLLSRIFALMRSFLQSSGEVAWPIIAERGMGNQGFRQVLLRSNAWIYGTVAGVVCVTLIPFCRWYVDEAYIPTPLVLYLVAARFIITGLATPAAYVLYGLGEFTTLTRCLQRELIAACILSVILGIAYGLPGVAWAFLLATSFGTLYPMIRAYARVANESTRGVLGQVWWRLLAGFTYSAFWAWSFLQYFPSGPGTVVPAAAGFFSGVMLAVVISFVRARDPASLFHSPQGLTQLLKSI